MEIHDSVSILFYTSIAYSDLWEAHFDKMKKYLNLNIDVYVVVNEEPGVYDKLSKLYPFKEIIFRPTNLSYDVNHYGINYFKILKLAIDKISTPYVLLWPDTNMIYDYTNIEAWNSTIKWIRENQPYIVKLFYQADDNETINTNFEHIEGFIYKSPSANHYQYSIGIPSIWRKDILYKFYEYDPNTKYPATENICFQDMVRGNSYFIWDNTICTPIGCGRNTIGCIIKSYYIITEGKWIMFNCPDFIGNLCQEYQIDINKRSVKTGCWHYLFRTRYYIEPPHTPHQCVNQNI